MPLHGGSSYQALLGWEQLSSFLIRRGLTYLLCQSLLEPSVQCDVAGLQLLYTGTPIAIGQASQVEWLQDYVACSTEVR